MCFESPRNMYHLPIVCFSFMNGGFRQDNSRVSKHFNFLYSNERRLQLKVSNFAFLFAR